MASTGLPIWDVHDEIMNALLAGNRLVLIAPTGSGKSTQVPQMLVELPGNEPPGKIVILQPRRVAARSLAARVARERGGNLGREVGYQIRFEDQISPQTRIAFVTEGILVRWLQDNPNLDGISAILFDEFHERNLLSDVALALVKHLQSKTRPDLKVVVMSATLDAEPVAHYLDDCPILVSEGQSYPVTIHYQRHASRNPVPEQAADVVRQIVDQGDPGDILVFMPGMGEINATLNSLRSLGVREPLTLLPLHGDLAPEMQDQAFMPSPNRKIVVSTNVAETSVTIEGIRHVIDSGLARIARYDSERGLGTLHLEEISRASADQRKGRAGRTDTGHCYRLWTESSQLNRPERNTPEIQRTDLAEVVLLLHALHIKEAITFDWLDKPNPSAIERAENLLRMLGALDPSTRELTPIGHQMRRLPMHPRYSRMLVEASQKDLIFWAALCAALVSGRDLLLRVNRGDKQLDQARESFEQDDTSDFFTLIQAYLFAQDRNFNLEACRQMGIHAQTARLVAQTHEQLLQIARRLNPASPDQPLNSEALLQCIMTGFIDQLARRRDQGSLECLLTENRTGTLMRESVVRNSPLMVVASMREISGRGRGVMTLLGLASKVELDWIRQVFPQHLAETTEHLFDRTHKRVAALRRTRLHDLVLEEHSVKDLDDRACGASLGQAYLDGHFELPLFKHELRQFAARCNFISAAAPELEYPALDEAAMLRALTRAFHGCRLAKEAQKLPLAKSLRQHLAPEQIEWLDELAPLSLPWPDGKQRKLLYPEMVRDKKGKLQPPEIQIKLHECFALAEHPKVCEGKVAVKLFLTAPNGKKLAVTEDWPSFRRVDYPKLKPTLLQKHPGVGWL